MSLSEFYAERPLVSLFIVCLVTSVVVSAFWFFETHKLMKEEFSYELLEGDPAARWNCSFPVDRLVDLAFNKGSVSRQCYDACYSPCFESCRAYLVTPGSLTRHEALEEG